MNTQSRSIIRIHEAVLATTLLFRKIVLATALGLPVLYFAAHPAVAAPTGPLGCGGEFGVGGCAPYAQLTYDAGDGVVSLFEYESSGLGLSVNGTTANVSGGVNLAAGTLNAMAYGTGEHGGFMIAQATDVFTLHSASSGVASFTVNLTAEGLGNVANNGYTGQVLLQLGVPGGGGGNFDAGVYQGFDTLPVSPSPSAVLTGTDFSLFSTAHGGPLSAMQTFLVELNTPFSFGYSLRANAQQGTLMDLSSTAHLSFVLDKGTSITSMGGYGLSTVPLPAGLPLFLSGLVGLGLLGRRRRVQGGRSGMVI